MTTSCSASSTGRAADAASRAPRHLAASSSAPSARLAAATAKWRVLLRALAQAYPEPHIAAAHLRDMAEGFRGHGAHQLIHNAAVHRASAPAAPAGAARAMPLPGSAGVRAARAGAPVAAWNVDAASRKAAAEEEDAWAMLDRALAAPAASAAGSVMGPPSHGQKEAQALSAQVRAKAAGGANGKSAKSSSWGSRALLKPKAAGLSGQLRPGHHVRSWEMAELERLEDAWRPGDTATARAERLAAIAAEEARLRAARPSRPSSDASVAGAELPAAKCGRPSSSSSSSSHLNGTTAVASSTKALNGGGSSRGGDDVLDRLLSGNFLGVAPAAAPPQPSAALAKTAASSQAAQRMALAGQRERESRASALVKQMHAAAAMDTALPSSGARLRLLPALGMAVRDSHMPVPLLRAGILSAIRRTLQTAADSHLSKADVAERLRLSLFGLLRALAPAVQPAHLRLSRGLGKLLMLIAASTSERRDQRAAAASLLSKLTAEGGGESAPNGTGSGGAARGVPPAHDRAHEARAGEASRPRPRAEQPSGAKRVRFA